MLIAISGSQGTGKTTVLKELDALGFRIVGRKTSRSILADWGVTLEEVNDSQTLTVKFQEEIIKRKMEDERDAAASTEEIWFTERTYTDLFVYNLITLGKHNQWSDFIDDYYNKCKQLNNTYSLVFYLRAGHFVPEHDGVRGSNKHYSRMVDLLMLDFTKQMIDNERLIELNLSTVEKRLDYITAYLQS